MREIKFRGKRKDNGEWIYGCLIIEKDVYVITCDKICYLVIPETVGQYTGRKDKNGKEIYEGDIVKHQYDENVECVLEVRFGKYETGFDGDCASSATGIGFHFRWIKGGRDFLGTPYMEHLGKEWCKHYLGEHIDWETEFEVIGNIYENNE